MQSSGQFRFPSSSCANRFIRILFVAVRLSNSYRTASTSRK
jgi:hypothetical protein